MQVVQLPDGTLAHFEDGVSPEELRRYVVPDVPDVPDAVADPGSAPADGMAPHVPYQQPVRLFPEELNLPVPAAAVQDTAPERSRFHRPFADVPILSPIFGASDAFQTGATQGMTWGFADEITAGLMAPIEMGIDAFQGKPFDPGRSYGQALETVRADDRETQEAYPLAHGTGNFAGGAVSGGQFAKAGLTLMNAAKPTLASFVPRAAVEGAIYGGIQGFGSGDSLEDRVNRAIEGAKIGALLGAATGAVGGSIASKSSQSAIPGAVQLNDEARGLYRAAGEAGAMLPQQQSAAMANSMRQIAINEGTMTHAGELVDGFPKVAGVIEELEGFGQGPLSIDQIQSARTFIQNAMRSSDDIERRTARNMLLEFHRYLDTISPEIATANAIYHRTANADMLETLVRAAARQADQSKQSLDSLLRQRFGDLQQQILEGHAQGFSEAEKEVISGLAQGGRLEKLLALIGGTSVPISPFASSGAGVYAHLQTGDPVIGAGVGAATGTALTGGGLATRKGADALAHNRARQAVALSLLGEASVPPAHPVISPVVQALIAGQSGQAPEISDELMWFLPAPN